MMMVHPQSETLALTLPRTLSLHVTLEQFEALSRVNDVVQLERTATGELIVTPPTGGESGKRNFSINAQVGAWVEVNEQLGEGFDSSTGFILPNGAIRSPDVSWVRQERWDALTSEQRQGFVPLCPDFVIELRSKSDSLATLQPKMQEYIDNGTSLGWLINPKKRQVEIYRPNTLVEVLDDPATLSGEDILPGFSLKLSKIW